MKHSLRQHRLLIAFCAGPLLIGAISVLAWFILTGGPTRAPMQIEYLIPVGTAARVAAGETVPSIPAQAVFVVGDVLLLRNEDKVHHNLGPFWIPAGTSLRIPLERPTTLNYLCSIHPTGSIGLIVRARNGLLQTLVPTLLLGLPLGGLLGLVLQVASRLDTA